MFLVLYKLWGFTFTLIILGNFIQKIYFNWYFMYGYKSWVLESTL